jgi:hypothetical protein
MNTLVDEILIVVMVRNFEVILEQTLCVEEPCNFVQCHVFVKKLNLLNSVRTASGLFISKISFYYPQYIKEIL